MASTPVRFALTLIASTVAFGASAQSQRFLDERGRVVTIEGTSTTEQYQRSARVTPTYDSSEGLEQRLVRIEREMEAAQAQIQTLKLVNENLQARLDRVGGEGISTRVQLLESQAGTGPSALRDLENRVAAVERGNGSSQESILSRVAALESKASVSPADLGGLESRVESLETSGASATSSLQSEVSALSARLEVAERLVSHSGPPDDTRQFVGAVSQAMRSDVQNLALRLAAVEGAVMEQRGALNSLAQANYSAAARPSYSIPMGSQMPYNPYIMPSAGGMQSSAITPPVTVVAAGDQGAPSVPMFTVFHSARTEGGAQRLAALMQKMRLGDQVSIENTSGVHVVYAGQYPSFQQAKAVSEDASRRTGQKFSVRDNSGKSW